MELFEIYKRNNKNIYKNSYDDYLLYLDKIKRTIRYLNNKNLLSFYNFYYDINDNYESFIIKNNININLLYNFLLNIQFSPDYLITIYDVNEDYEFSFEYSLSLSLLFQHRKINDVYLFIFKETHDIKSITIDDKVFIYKKDIKFNEYYKMYNIVNLK
jgi:hypothetical protein